MGDAVRASTELRAQGGIGSARGGEEIGSGEKDGIRSELEESRLARTQAAVVGDGEAKAGEVVKKRRGRPPRDQGKIPPTAMDNDDEDVCFICFDGGSLVLCDRRGCPKAYHPACIKRDEAFFQSAARWNCGWHICSTCQKTSHFMCYTCTFSLCKRCTKGVDFLCVRGNKGFCNICLNMVKLIENSEQGNKEMAQVDFDDKTSWEYLFKVYWIYLKTKLSLTFDELKKAKRVDVSVSLSRKGGNSDDLYANNRSFSDSDYFGKSQEEPHSKRRKTRQWPIALPKEAPQREEQVGAQILTSHPTPTAWASKDLLEFVSNMTKGDTSSLTPLDAQSLLLHYIKINGLRDPNCQSQIICDSRLRNMFGKARIGHIEMLNLVEYHFPSRQQSHAEIAAYIGRNDSNGVKVDEVDENNDNHLLGKDMKSKRHKKDDNKGRETIHDGYAAIDVHNINLIYLPLHLMEKLLVDDKFHEKVVGSIVRIKMSSSDQKQDVYRLVQVVGTIKIDELYKVRNRLSGWKLEILNISKKEIISIDEISDQEFSEDECKRFRQSIKYGLATGFTVGEMLEKAVVLRTVKVTNFIETETLRFQHLRDRATEKGQNKEFKEYVHKIELLNSPGEHLHMQNEVPEVHEDPNMDPRHQSEEDIRLSFHKNHGDSTVAMQSGMKCKGNYSTSLLRFDSVMKKNRANAPWLSTSSKEDMKASSIHGRTDIPTNYLEQNAYLSNARNQIGNSDSSIQLKATSAINHSVVQNEMLCGAVTGTSGVPVCTDDVDTDKIWHYQDPSWNIQGPFSMLQLRRWNTSGYFPVDLRIWKTGEKQDESILLTDALEGQFCKKPRLIYNTCEMSIHSNGSSEFVRSSCSSSLSTPAENVVNSREGQCADSLRSHKSLSSHSQFSSSPSTQTSAGKACEALSLLAQESWNAPRCSNNYYPEHEVCHNQFSPIPNLNSEDLESQKAENKEVNLIPNLAEIPRDESAEEKQFVPLPIIHQAQLNSGVNLSSIASESQQMGTKQSAPYVHHIESEALHANPQLVIGGGQIQAVTAEHMNNDLKSQCTDNQTVVGSDLPLPDSDSGWTDGSCLLNASGDHPLMPVEQNAWTSNPLNGSLPKPNELVVDVTPTTDAALPTTGQYGFPSPFQFWHSIFGEDDEFPFADESVSDLLAEVDAMECLNGPASPTSDMVRDMEFSQTSKEDCFGSVGGLKPNS